MAAHATQPAGVTDPDRTGGRRPPNVAWPVACDRPAATPPTALDRGRLPARPGASPSREGRGLPQRRRGRREAGRRRARSDCAAAGTLHRAARHRPRHRHGDRQALDGEVPEHLAELEATDGHPARRRAPRSARRAQGRLPHPLHLERRRRPDRDHGPHRHGPRPRVPGAHRPLAPPHHRPRPQPRAAARPSSTRSPRSTRSWPRSASSPASRSTSSRTAPSTRTRTCSTGSTSWWPASTPSCGWTREEMTRAHGDGRRQPPRRHPRPLHRPQGRSARRRGRAVRLRRRDRVRRLRPVRHRGRDQLPARAPGPARRAARRWPSSGAARSASTPTPTPRASSSGRPTAATRPPATASSPSASSTPGPPTTSSPGPPPTPPTDPTAPGLWSAGMRCGANAEDGVRE